MEQHELEKKKEEEVAEKNSENHTKKTVKIFTIIGLIAIILSLVIVKANIEGFSLKWFWILTGMIVVAAIIIFFIFELKNILLKNAKNEEAKRRRLPEPITVEKAFHLIEEELAKPKYADYIDYGKIKDDGVENHGRHGDQSIFFILFKTLYSDRFMMGAINMHYPKRNLRLKTDPSPYEQNYIKKKLAVDPEPAGDKTVIETTNPFGGSIKETRISSSRKNDNKSTKKGDLK